MTSQWRHRASGRSAAGGIRKKSQDNIQKIISLAVVGIFSNSWCRWKAEIKSLKCGPNHFCDIGSESIEKSFWRYRLFRHTRKWFSSPVGTLDVWNSIYRSLIVSQRCILNLRVVSFVVRLQSSVAYRYYRITLLIFSVKFHKLYQTINVWEISHSCADGWRGAQPWVITEMLLKSGFRICNLMQFVVGY